MSASLEAAFPQLLSSGYRVTSPPDQDYNCIAWAAGDGEQWWWPDPLGLYYWPDGVLRAETLEAFVACYRHQGYEQAANSDREPGWEKIALYADENGTPTHAARQLPSGAWTSKLGQLEDIEHSTPEALTSAVYGKAAITLRRRCRVGEEGEA